MRQVEHLPEVAARAGVTHEVTAAASRRFPARIAVAALIVSLIALLPVGIYLFNDISLQSKMNDVLRSDARNTGLRISTHFEHYIFPQRLVFDLQEVSGTNSMADVFRAFLQLAERLQERQFDAVKLAHRGRVKFMISGKYFRQLGREYKSQNPGYTARTFPENLMNPDGSQAYSKWTGGLLGVLVRQMEDFNDFHKKWYLAELSGQ